ncbi:hypothetical protein ACJX0J_037510, partial [Zea mays]
MSPAAARLIDEKAQKHLLYGDDDMSLSLNFLNGPLESFPLIWQIAFGMILIGPRDIIGLCQYLSHSAVLGFITFSDAGYICIIVGSEYFLYMLVVLDDSKDLGHYVYVIWASIYLCIIIVHVHYSFSLIIVQKKAMADEKHFLLEVAVYVVNTALTSLYSVARLIGTQQLGWRKTKDLQSFIGLTFTLGKDGNHRDDGILFYCATSWNST